MASKTYGFNTQLQQGADGEALLDEYFSRYYRIRKAEMDDQRRGIDRFFEAPWLPRPEGVEYKTDSLTQRTGNVFIETFSVVEKNVLGWARKSEADILVYFALPDTICMAYMEEVKEKVDEWLEMYGQRSVRNRGYTSMGIPVPRDTFWNDVCFNVVLL